MVKTTKQQQHVGAATFVVVTLFETTRSKASIKSGFARPPANHHDAESWTFYAEIGVPNTCQDGDRFTQAFRIRSGSPDYGLTRPRKGPGSNPH